MKKIHFLLLVLFTIHTTANSQSWIQKGSTWHYDFWNLGTVGFYKLNYDKDTVIQGHNCQIITDSIYLFYYYQNNNVIYANTTATQNEYTYNSGDSVFYYNDSTFYLLYDFGANIGDSWLISNDTALGCQQTILQVTDTGHIIINNQNLRWINVESNNGGGYYMKGKVIESIGFTELDSNTTSINTTLFPRPVICDSTVSVEYDFLNFKCFSDSNGIIYNPSGEDCEYYWTHLAVNNIIPPKINIKLFPNPTNNGSITISLNKKFKTKLTINFYSLNGQKIKTVEISNDVTSKTIDICKLNSGLYFYKVFTNNTELGSGKLIVTE